MTAYITNGVTPAAQEELAFFDRAKKFLDQREAYEDFLKLLNLYTKDILGIKDLLFKVDELFAGDLDLCTQFRVLIEWDDDRDGQGMGNVERGPPGSLRMGPPEALSAVPVDDGLGPSYRRCPDSVSILLS
jgi:paired amphipathic helix protein Sin3a